jgi:hypothetical protein
LQQRIIFNFSCDLDFHLQTVFWQATGFTNDSISEYFISDIRRYQYCHIKIVLF